MTRRIIRSLATRLMHLGGCFGFTATLATFSYGQGVIAQPYNGQLRTDPAVGNVQGIQRYGRPLKTDPQQGEGFSYHVYPVAQPQAVHVAAVPRAPQLLPQLQTREAQKLEETIEAKTAARDTAFDQQDAAGVQQLEQELTELRRQKEVDDLKAQVQALSYGVGYGGGGYGVPRGAAYGRPVPFDSTAGLRNYGNPGAPELLENPYLASGLVAARGIGIGVENGAKSIVSLYNQPLIQIRIRVVEVARSDDLSVNSILEYVSRANTDPSLTTGLPLNQQGGQGFENLRGRTAFEIPGLFDGATGAGGLINLTSEHINWAVSFLASEFNGDVITAPEVVTLNGQNVEFVSGDKLPFQLGQNVIQGTNNNIQQFFFKNIGTYVSVTPKIVNWGFYGEKKGEADIIDNEIKDWNALMAWMLNPANFNLADTTLREQMALYATNSRPVPYELKRDVLQTLNEFTRSDIVGPRIPASHAVETGVNPQFTADYLLQVAEWYRPDAEWFQQCAQCDWKPEDCTIDLATVIRLSDKGVQNLSTETEGELTTEQVNVEQNVRAVANVIQIKSGEGVVMAGLIGEREEEIVSKVPILGDIPYVGAPFRSKETLRQKTELLIFLEAKVLDREPAVARAQTAHDFRLGRAYVDGELLDNPLECGMYRAGFGTYLPPIRHGEEQYWIRHHRKLRKIATHIDDIKE